MHEKFCNGCKSLKSIEDFWKKRGKPQAQCKDCQREYHKLHYKNNKKDYLVRAKERKKIVQAELRSYIAQQKNKPCMDCNQKYPSYVMDFDHRPDCKKEFTIANMVSDSKSFDCIKKEIDKCDVVCSNCHRIRTHNREMSRYPSG